MQITVKDNHIESSKYVAQQIVRQLNKKPNTKLGLATGKSYELVYKFLVAHYKSKEVSFRAVHTVNLDEYVNISGTNPRSYRYYMDEKLFNHIDIEKTNTYVPVATNDPSAELEVFRHKIKENGPIDLQLLGLGRSGHIAFNEPAQKLKIYAHIEKLDQSTIDANSVYFATAAEVPKESFTMGMGDIGSAKKILLLAAGETKLPAIRSLVNSKYIDPQLPASFLYMHPAVELVIDKDLAPELQV